MFGLLLSQVGFHRQFRDSEHCLVLAFDNVGITRAHTCAAGNAASAVNPSKDVAETSVAEECTR